MYEQSSLHFVLVCVLVDLYVHREVQSLPVHCAVRLRHAYSVVICSVGVALFVVMFISALLFWRFLLIRLCAFSFRSLLVRHIMFCGPILPRN